MTPSFLFVCLDVVSLSLSVCRPASRHGLMPAAATHDVSVVVWNDATARAIAPMTVVSGSTQLGVVLDCIDPRRRLLAGSGRPTALANTIVAVALSTRCWVVTVIRLVRTTGHTADDFATFFRRKVDDVMALSQQVNQRQQSSTRRRQRCRPFVCVLRTKCDASSCRHQRRLACWTSFRYTWSASYSISCYHTSRAWSTHR